MRSLLSRIKALIQRRKLDDEFDDELQSHLEMLAADFEARGMAPEEALRAARLKLGPPRQLREENRDARGLPGLEDLARDLRFAVRSLRQSPAFTFTAVATLSLGIGLCSFLFSILYGMVLRPLAGASEPSRLVAIGKPITYPEFQRLGELSEVISAASVFIGPAPFRLHFGNGEPERVSGHLVSPEYFRTLGIQPAMGRLFDPSLERPGEPLTVVITDRLWRTRFGADPRAVGSTVRINRQPATVVGIAPEDFVGVFPASPVDVFVPVTAEPSVAPELSGDALRRPTDPVFRVVMRLAPNISVGAAEAALDAQVRAVERAEARPDRDRPGRRVTLFHASGSAPMPIRQSAIYVAVLGLLMALILSFTCANLAGLTLARGGSRSREFAIRLSLGAGRFRLIRGLIIESFLLALAGGAAGLAAAYGAVTLLAKSLEDSPVLHPDLRVIGVTFLAASLAGLGFGLVPAFATSRPDLVTSLKRMPSAMPGRCRRFGARNLFMTYQVAAAMVLVLIVGFMMTGIQRGAYGEDPGFDTRNLYRFTLDPPRDGLAPAESGALLDGLTGRLGRVSGVERAALSDRQPFIRGVGAPNITVAVSTGGKEVIHRVLMQTVGPDFFSTIGVPLARGAEFSRRDAGASANAPVPAVINHVAAREMFGGADPMGRAFTQDRRTFQVAGIVRYGKPAVFRDEPVASVFVPLTGAELQRSCCTVLVRMRPGTDLAPVRAALESIDSRLTMIEPQTVRDFLAEEDRQVQYVTSVYPAIGLFALLLACVGLSGVTAQEAQRRRKEIGIRAALGARPFETLRMVMSQGTALILTGCILGFGAAWALLRAITAFSSELGQLYGGVAIGLNLLLGAPGLLLASAALACFLPARRAAALDPMTILRED